MPAVRLAWRGVCAEMGNRVDRGAALPLAAARRVRSLLAAGALAFAALLACALSGATGSRAATAHAARTFTLSDTGHLHKTSGRGITINQVLNEQGSASGTISGTIYIHLRVV